MKFSICWESSLLLLVAVFSEPALAWDTSPRTLLAGGAPPGLYGACQIAPVVSCESGVRHEWECAELGARNFGSRWTEGLDCTGRKPDKKKSGFSGVCHVTKDPGQSCLYIQKKGCEDLARSKGGAQWSWKQDGRCQPGVTPKRAG